MPSANRTPFRGWLQGAFGEEPVPPAGASVESDAPRPPTARASLVGLTTSAAPPHILDMVRIAISQAAFDARSLLALLMILLAAPACAGSRFGGGFHGGGFHGGGFHGGGFHGGGFHAFHRSVGRAHGFFGGYVCGYNCGLGFDSGGYDYGYGGGYGYGNDYGNDYGGRGGNVRSSNGLTGGYVPDPVGADIPPMVIRTNCWVRRAAYDPSGAFFGQVLVDLCRRSDSVTVTGLKARPKTPDTGSGAPKSPQ